MHVFVYFSLFSRVLVCCCDFYSFHRVAELCKMVLTNKHTFGKCIVCLHVVTFHVWFDVDCDDDVVVVVVFIIIKVGDTMFQK